MLEDKFVLLKVEYEFVCITCEVNPESRKDIWQEGNELYYN